MTLQAYSCLNNTTKKPSLQNKLMLKEVTSHKKKEKTLPKSALEQDVGLGGNLLSSAAASSQSAE